jgi:hypothetical protein
MIIPDDELGRREFLDCVEARAYAGLRRFCNRREYQLTDENFLFESGATH